MLFLDRFCSKCRVFVVNFMYLWLFFGYNLTSVIWLHRRVPSGSFYRIMTSRGQYSRQQHPDKYLVVTKKEEKVNVENKCHMSERVNLIWSEPKFDAIDSESCVCSISVLPCHIGYLSLSGPCVLLHCRENTHTHKHSVHVKKTHGKSFTCLCFYRNKWGRGS